MLQNSMICKLRSLICDLSAIRGRAPVEDEKEREGSKNSEIIDSLSVMKHSQSGNIASTFFFVLLLLRLQKYIMRVKVVKNSFKNLLVPVSIHSRNFCIWFGRIGIEFLVRVIGKFGSNLHGFLRVCLHYFPIRKFDGNDSNLNRILKCLNLSLRTMS